MWEIPALAIMNELRSRQATKRTGPLRARRALCARAKAKLWSEVERLRKLDGLAAVGLRHPPTPWLSVAALVRRGRQGGPRPSFTGTSNVLLAMDNDLEAIGTNAHELPMVARGARQ